jgi:hypothetical protein
MRACLTYPAGKIKTILIFKGSNLFGEGQGISSILQGKSYINLNM